ncbi:MAG: AMP-binding protein [Thermodesulfobacteriota bacterium]|nr:AMP-binding protein [Thermodesulfobacteriota bacterium]
MREDTIPTLFQTTAKKYDERVALRKKEYGIWTDISWREYAENVKHIALGLLSLGLKKGECVTLIGENRPEWLYADLAIMSAGGITSAIYTTNSPGQCEYIIQHSEARFHIAEDEEQLDKVLKTRDNLPNLEKIIIIDMEGLKHFKDPMVMSIEELAQSGRDLDERDPALFETHLNEPNPEDTALLIYTSGTTGPPKGAMLSHANILWTTEALREATPFYESDELLSFLPLSHIAERMFSVFCPIRYGYTVNFIENTDTVTQNMVEVSPTVFFAVPRIWEKYYSTIAIRMSDATWLKRSLYYISLKIGAKDTELKLANKKVPLLLRGIFLLVHFSIFRKLKEKLGFDRVRLAISGAAPISPDVLRYYHGIGIPLREIYGQTEDCGPTSIHLGENIKTGTVGQAIPGVEIRIADDGEILVKGPNVFQGYFKNPEATRETLRDGWLHSGDMGELDEEGYLKITDRKKDLIITAGGKNISPQNIENQLKFSPYINDAIVIGDRKKYLTALIMIDEDNVVKYAQDNRIPFTTYADLSKNPEITRLIAKEVEKVNKTLAHVETIKKFTLFDKRLDEEDGELTPTMKVKRKYINEMYKDVIDSMY